MYQISSKWLRYLRVPFTPTQITEVIFFTSPFTLAALPLEHVQFLWARSVVKRGKFSATAKTKVRGQIGFGELNINFFSGEKLQANSTDILIVKLLLKSLYLKATLFIPTDKFFSNELPLLMSMQKYLLFTLIMHTHNLFRNKRQITKFLTWK